MPWPMAARWPSVSMARGPRSHGAHSLLIIFYFSLEPIFGPRVIAILAVLSVTWPGEFVAPSVQASTADATRSRVN